MNYFTSEGLTSILIFVLNAKMVDMPQPVFYDIEQLYYIIEQERKTC